MKSSEIVQSLRVTADTVKCKLAKNDEATAGILSFVHDGKSFDIDTSLSIEQLRTCTAKLVTNTINKVDEALAKINITKADIFKILLVGGSTRLRCVIEAVVKRFTPLQVSNELNADTIVAIGAAYEAGRIMNEEDAPYEDVAPLGLGLGVSSGNVRRLIKADARLPIEYEETFQTTVDQQQWVELTIYEGDRHKCTDCHCLATFTVPVLPAAKGVQKVRVRFILNTDGEHLHNKTMMKQEESVTLCGMIN